MAQAGDVVAAPSKATPREWLGLAVIALPCMLYSMDLTVLNLAVPSLARDLKPSASQLLWIIDIYGFMVAGFLIIMGALGDRFGRRKILLIGAVAFGLTSIFAAFASSAEMLILARALLGIAGATLAPSTLSLIASMFRDENERSFAISMWIASFSAGAIIGPLAGGILIHYFWWGSVFLLAVPAMALLLAVGPVLLPEYRNEEVTPIDAPSAMLSLASILSLVFGAKHFAETGFDSIVLAALAFGLGLGAVFFTRQSRIAHPLVDLALFGSPVFSLSLAINMLALFFMFGVFVFFAQYLQLVAGLTAFEAGLWSLPSAIAFTVMSFFNARLAAAYSSVTLIAGGLIVSALGSVLVLLSESLPVLVLSMLIMGVGFTPVIALTTGYIVGAAPPEKVGVASALSETSGELGGALGIALLGSLATFIYRSRMAGIGLPPGTDTGVRTSLAAALESGAASNILETARGAFMDAFSAAALISAAVLVGLALLALRLLSNAQSQQHGG
ncbi:MAG: MFS transporter [Rhizobiales bacterium]|nr:MFS transporter [Hyphomicrobiales bacterium]